MARAQISWYKPLKVARVLETLHLGLKVLNHALMVRGKAPLAIHNF